MTSEDRKLSRRFVRIATAGILFQGGQASVDPSTVVAALVDGLTGSTAAIGAAAGISRFGWLFPQLIVAYIAQRRRRRLPIYQVGAFGRAACLAGIGALLWGVGGSDRLVVAVLFFALWTAYAFVSGIVAVPYNDIVARAIPSSHRSRLLATRFFGGGLLALGVAAIVHELLAAFPFHPAYALVFLMAAALFTGSALSFVAAGEPPAPAPPRPPPGFRAFLREGVAVFTDDRRFRLFLGSRWLAGAVTMALPFYILQVPPVEDAGRPVAILLGAQVAGALMSNPLWGWWGDRRGKRSLLELVAILGVAAPALTIAWLVLGNPGGSALVWFVLVFFLLGAVGNGETIAMLGYLMEISPDDRRPAYSGYFNALAAPATLLPLAGAGIAQLASFPVLFAVSAAAALAQFRVVRHLRTVRDGEVR
ncbi:MAG: MFS transporter [Kiloniellaceae bacterium]